MTDHVETRESVSHNGASAPAGGQESHDAHARCAAGDPFTRLPELQTLRRHAIRMQIKIDNGTVALFARALGYHSDLPEKEGKRIFARARKAIEAVESGEAPEDDLAALTGFALAAARGREPFDTLRRQTEKEMAAIAAALPVWPAFAQNVKGFGALSLAIIVGEAGDLTDRGNPDGPGYIGPAKLWRRLGLAPWDGHAGKTWRIEKWRPRALTKEEWTAFGYSPKRRAEMHVIADCLIRYQRRLDKATGESKAVGPYGAIYGARRQRTAETHPDWTPQHSHADALRVMVKAFLRDLWCAWNGRAVKTEHGKDTS